MDPGGVEDPTLLYLRSDAFDVPISESCFSRAQIVLKVVGSCVPFPRNSVKLTM